MAEVDYNPNGRGLLSVIPRSENQTQIGGYRFTQALLLPCVFPFRNEDGELAYEFRSAEELSRADTLDSLRGAPLTLGTNEVTAQNWRHIVVGHLGSEIEYSRGIVSARLYVLVDVNYIHPSTTTRSPHRPPWLTASPS